MDIGVLRYLFWLKSAESLCACPDFLSINCPKVYAPSTHVDTYINIRQFRIFDLSLIVDIFKYRTAHNMFIYGVKPTQEILQLHTTTLGLTRYAKTTVYECVVEADDSNSLD